ncbi:MAG: hypothetical protein ACFBWO_07715 [Paracoccaceae bacterium]
MFDRRAIMLNAWARFRQGKAARAELIARGLFVHPISDRERFARALRNAWADAKREVAERRFAAWQAARPAPTAAERELFCLDCKDRWSPADHARAAVLHRTIAAERTAAAEAPRLAA